MSTDRLQIIYEKLQRKGHVWYSIIKAIETATPKLRKKVKTSYDRMALSSISTQITKARREHSIFQTRLKEIKNQMEYKTSSYYDIKNDLNELNNEAQSAIEKLRDIAKDIVDIRDINTTNSTTKTNTQEQEIGLKPPAPPSAHPSVSISKDLVYNSSGPLFHKNNDNEISNSSSPASTMMRQRTEISDLRDRIKSLRDSFSTKDQENIVSAITNKSTQQTIKKVTVSKYQQKSSVKNASNNNKPSKRVFDFEQEEYLKKFDKFGNIEKDLDKTWIKLDNALNQNVMSNKLIADEIEYLRKKINDYQEIVQSAAELCRNSAMLINNKNQDLNAVVSEKQMIEEQWTVTKTELQKLKKSKSNIDTEYRKQCTLNNKLQKENTDLRRSLENMQNEFQSEIDILKEELNAQIEYSKRVQQSKSYGADRGNFDSILESLLKQLEIEDETAKYEISNIMKSYRKKRQRLFNDAAQYQQ